MEEQLFGLSEIFQKIADHEQTGSLKIQKDDKEIFIYFKEGNVRTLGYPHKRSVLAAGMQRCSKFSKEDLEAIFAKQRKTKKTLTEAIKEADIAEEFKETSFVVNICSSQISEDLYEILGWEEVRCEFLENNLVEGVFEPDLLELPIRLNPSSLAMEGARRKDEWEMINEMIQSTKDVPYLLGTKEELAKVRKTLNKEASAGEDVIDEFLAAINGINDFEEILEQVRMNSFDAMKLLSMLRREKHIDVKSAEDIKQIAHLEVVQKNLNKCIKLYERSEELGLKNFDTIKWLSRAYENTGLTNKAVEKYRELGQITMDNHKYDEAIRSYSKVVKFDPEDLVGYEKLKNAYIKHGQLEKAAEVSATYAKKVAVTDKRKAIAILDEANRNYPSSHSNLELMASLYQQMGDRENAILTYNILANLMKKKNNMDKALDAYRKILLVDKGDVKAHLEIAKGYIESAQIDEGVRQYKELGNILIRDIHRPKNSDLNENCKLLEQVCDTMMQFEPKNTTAREWLAEACVVQGNKEKALKIFKELLTLLQVEENHSAMVSTLRKIVEMSPEDFQNRKCLADTLLRLKNRLGAIREYSELGKLCCDKNDVRRAREAYDAIITIDPFNLNARQKRAELLCNLNLHARAIEEYKLVGYLSKAVEKIPEAIEAFSKMVELAPEKELWGAVEVARLCESLQEYQKAITYYKQYAQSQRTKGNYSEVDMACTRILALEANNFDALSMKQEIEKKFAQLNQQLQSLS